MSSADNNQVNGNHPKANETVTKDQSKPLLSKYVFLCLGGILIGILAYFLLMNTPFNDILKPYIESVAEHVGVNIAEYFFVAILSLAGLFVLYTCIRAPQFFKNAKVNKKKDATKNDTGDATNGETSAQFEGELEQEDRDTVQVLHKEESQQESVFESPVRRIKFFEKASHDRKVSEDGDFIPIDMIHQSYVDSGRKG
ncbi:unnamed protein product [Moneuplotes crassus]|uniref:Uncharacterized protein n=1 Tax=Euplotes crassus TaxID=5936 RepID=A0AAD1XRR3_EUPCR|nr:unnamed protein product [Moneuplotes crassus]